jgi:predicted RNA-binding protein YlqC (UPF0109 family)
MKDLLVFLLKGVLGEEKFEVEETEDNGRIVYTIQTDSKNAGLVIGKGGRMIKSLRNLLKVRATLEKKAVALNLGEE